MKTKFLTTAAVVLALSLSTGAQASLVARTGGMVYDDVNNITWAADANLAKTSGYDADGLMTWANAVAWADQLTLGGYTDWSWGGENIFYKNAPAFNPCIDCFLFTYQKLEKKHKNTIFLA